MGKRGIQRTTSTLLHEVAERIPALPPIIAAHILEDLVASGPGRLSRPNEEPILYLSRYVGKLLRGEHVSHEQRRKAIALLQDPGLYKSLTEEEAHTLLDDFTKEPVVSLTSDGVEEHPQSPQEIEAVLDGEEKGTEQPFTEG